MKEQPKRIQVGDTNKPKTINHLKYRKSSPCNEFGDSSLSSAPTLDPSALQFIDLLRSPTGNASSFVSRRGEEAYRWTE
jgi:hypothetical protein